MLETKNKRRELLLPIIQYNGIVKRVLIVPSTSRMENKFIFMNNSWSNPKINERTKRTENRYNFLDSVTAVKHGTKTEINLNKYQRQLR